MYKERTAQNERITRSYVLKLFLHIYKKLYFIFIIFRIFLRILSNVLIFTKKTNIALKIFKV